jgi:hypothetical protein
VPLGNGQPPRADLLRRELSKTHSAQFGRRLPEQPPELRDRDALTIMRVQVLLDPLPDLFGVAPYRPRIKAPLLRRISARRKRRESGVFLRLVESATAMTRRAVSSGRERAPTTDPLGLDTIVTTDRSSRTSVRPIDGRGYGRAILSI